jgi:hypothetical protein
MSPASGDPQWSSNSWRGSTSFHSINVPSEWGRYNSVIRRDSSILVSIQLMSPASGDGTIAGFYQWSPSKVSIQLMSPASGDKKDPFKVYLFS